MEMTQCTCVAKCLNCSDRAEAAEAEVKRLREVMDRVGSDWRRRAKKAEAELEHQMVNLADWRDLAVRRLTEIEAAEASAAAMREALYAIRYDPSGCPMCDEGVLRGDAKEHWVRCGYRKLDAALSSSAGEALLERLRTSDQFNGTCVCGLDAALEGR